MVVLRSMFTCITPLNSAVVNLVILFGFSSFFRFRSPIRRTQGGCLVMHLITASFRTPTFRSLHFGNIQPILQRLNCGNLGVSAPSVTKSIIRNFVPLGTSVRTYTHRSCRS